MSLVLIQSARYDSHHTKNDSACEVNGKAKLTIKMVRCQFSIIICITGGCYNVYTSSDKSQAMDRE